MTEVRYNPVLTTPGADMPMTADPPESKSSLRTFAAASFLNDLGSDIIYPIWPLFVTTVLKANMAALGLIDGLGEAVVSLSQAASGYLSDKFRRRKIFIWTGYLCGSVSRLGYAISAIWPHLIPFKILDRMGKMRGAPRDAVIADISTDETRGRNFGLLRTTDNSGAFVGILISIMCLQLLGYRLLFALAALPSLISVVLILRNLKEKPSGRKIFKGLALRDISPNLRLYIGLNAVFALGAFSYSFLMVYAYDAGFKAGFVPVLYLVYTAAAALLSLPFGRLSDRIGRKAVLALALLFWAGVAALAAFGRGRAIVFGMFVLFGVHKAALEPVQKTLASEICPVDFRASCLGAFQMIVGLCALPASALAGFLWDGVGRTAPFILSLGLTAAAGVLLTFVRERHA